MQQFAYGFTIPLLWAMMADVADFSEWKNHRRATAVIFSAIIFGLKAGLGFGGAIGGHLLDWYGYVPNAEQTERALLGIRMTASIYPAIGFALCALCLAFYRIDKTTELEMSAELTERRATFVTPLPDCAMTHRHLSAALAASLCLAACSRATSTAVGNRGAPKGQGLKDTFRSAFLVGAALAPKQFEELDVANAALVKREFNTISPENVLKWVIVHPQPDRYDFAPGRQVRRVRRAQRDVHHRAHAGVAQPGAGVGVPGRAGPAAHARRAARANEGPHPDRGRPLQGAHQGLGRRQRSAERGRHAARDAVDEDHRPRLHREGVRVRARGGSRGGALLQRLQPGLRRQARRRGSPGQVAARSRDSRACDRLAGASEARRRRRRPRSIRASVPSPRSA